MKLRIIVLFLIIIVSIGTIGCTRTYNVTPKQTAIITDPATLEKIMGSECFQHMSFTIKVEDVSVPKTTELEISPRMK